MNPHLRIDLNNAEFQRQFFELDADAQRALLSTLRKLSRMSWDQIYRDRGLRWEAILSRHGPRGGRLYSLRVSRGFRAVAYREGDWLRLVSLHPDHDSAYR